jgi:hypothetical protein
LSAWTAAAGTIRRRSAAPISPLRSGGCSAAGSLPRFC